MGNTTLDHLQQQLQRWGQRSISRGIVPSKSLSGSWLPELRLSPGEVSEWIVPGDGAGTLQLALAAVREKEMLSGRWLVVDEAGDLNPVAWEEVGVDLSRTVFVRGIKSAEALWAVEQGLRSRGVDVVYCRFSRLTSVTGRRLKMAAEAGKALCLMFRGTEAFREPGWADLRVRVSPLPSPDWNCRRLRVEVLKIRHGFPGKVVDVELNDETGVVRMVSGLADSAPLHQATRA